jgi:hypothetical protein
MGKMIGQVTTYLRKIVLSKLSVPFEISESRSMSVTIILNTTCIEGIFDHVVLHQNREIISCAAIVLNVSTSVHTSSGMRDNIMLSQECHLFKEFR